MPEDMDNIRILRIIEYTGPREKVEDQVARSLHGEKRLPNGVTIKAATVGTYPEIIDTCISDDTWLKKISDPHYGEFPGGSGGNS